MAGAERVARPDRAFGWRAWSLVLLLALAFQGRLFSGGGGTIAMVTPAAGRPAQRHRFCSISCRWRAVNGWTPATI